VILINGKEVAEKKINEIKERIENFKQKSNLTPCLATILVGENPSSKVYISSKIKACQNVGIKSVHFNLSQNSSKKEIISKIQSLNADHNIHGILLQLPLPDNDFAADCINAMVPSKDVDGLHPYNAGLLTLSKNYQDAVKKNFLISCTPLGIIYLLESAGIQISKKTAVVIGRSNLVGKPISMLLLLNDATVIMTHSKTENLKEICKNADIIVSAIGKPNFINRDFIKEGAAVIDVGINRTDKKIVGDVDFNNVKDMDIYLTPVPGGVGPMTVACLLENTFKAFENTMRGGLK
jgi:methylenetetrahydrofolate dehydrogenase (NADP+)/methenyltetrahydrofolate cyclohydrolase